MCIYTFSKKLFNPSNKANPSKKKKVKVHSSTTQRVLSTDLFTILAMFYWIINEKKHLNFSGPPDPPVNCTVGEPDPFKVNQNQNQKCKVKKKTLFPAEPIIPAKHPKFISLSSAIKRFGCFQTRKTH